MRAGETAKDGRLGRRRGAIAFRAKRSRARRGPRDWVPSIAIVPMGRSGRSDLGDCASPMATPASCGGLLLPAFVLAAERIAASDPRRPAVGEYEVRAQRGGRHLP